MAESFNVYPIIIFSSFSSNDGSVRRGMLLPSMSRTFPTKNARQRLVVQTVLSAGSSTRLSWAGL